MKKIGASPAPYFSAKYFCMALILTATRSHKISRTQLDYKLFLMLQVVYNAASCLQCCKLFTMLQMAAFKHRYARAQRAAGGVCDALDKLLQM
jgi:hypothetical protein